MTLLERIKTLVFGKDLPPPVFDDTDLDRRRGNDYEHERTARPDVSTPADDPVMDDVGASGVQPVSKPRDIEEAQNPVRRSAPPMN